MRYGNKLCATLQLIGGSLFPGRRESFPPGSRNNNESIVIAPEDFAAALAELDSLLRLDGTLDLLFTEALSPAAPFLLFRLKRAGFSNCRAIATPKGILLTASR